LGANGGKNAGIELGWGGKKGGENGLVSWRRVPRRAFSAGSETGEQLAEKKREKCGGQKPSILAKGLTEQLGRGWGGKSGN